MRGMTVDRLHLIEEAHAELYPEFARAEKWFSLDELQDIVDWESLGGLWTHRISS